VDASTGIIEVIVEQYVHDIRGVSDQQVEIACGADDATSYIDFQNYSRTLIGRWLGTGLLGIGTATPVSLLEVDGAIGTAIEIVTGNTTLNETHSTVLVNASGNVIITLPTAASAYNSTDEIGRIYEIKKIDADANTVTIDGDGAELIDGAAIAALTVQYESITVQSNGTSWFIL
jgi:Cu/Ag efflux protein CusF